MCLCFLTLYSPGGGGGGGANLAPPLDFSRDISETRNALAAKFRDNFRLSFARTFKTKLTAPGCMVRKLRNFLYMHVDWKVIKFVILCTNSIQIVYF